MSEIISLRGQRFLVDQCGTCGVLYVVPQCVNDTHIEQGGFSYCSNGHQWGWREGRHEREAIRRERDRLKQENARLIDVAEEAKMVAQKVEAELGRVQRRHNNGVCPCCHRSFANVARHMKSKHPEVARVAVKR